MVDRIDRRRLDFDFEKICSVTLSPVNVYVCLTCGKFLQGRTVNSPAHQHCLSEEHPLFMNLETKKAFRLPENEEFNHEGLECIRDAIYPTFTTEQVRRLDEVVVEGEDLHGRRFTAGFIGMNNIKANDYANVCLQGLLHIPPLRDLLLNDDFRGSPSHLLRSVSEAARKVWNLQPFKALLSPHEFMQAVNISSLRRYSINSQADATEFMAWLLNALHRDLSTLHQSNLVAKMMQGRVQVSTKKLRHNEIASVMQDGTFESKTVPFFYLTLDLPPIPLYQSSSGEFVVPQVSLERLLEKYDGGQLTQRGDLLQAFALEELPPFLLLHHRRFIKPHLIWEKNRTIVTHPMSGLIIKDAKRTEHRYDIIANICHRGEADLGKGIFFIQLLHPASGHWYEIDGLNVKQIPAVNIPLSESYLQIWQRSLK